MSDAIVHESPYCDMVDAAIAILNDDKPHSSYDMQMAITMLAVATRDCPAYLEDKFCHKLTILDEPLP